MLQNINSRGRVDDEDLKSIREARTEWEAETLEPFLEHVKRKDEFVTVSNHEVDRLYTPDDIADLDYDENRDSRASRLYPRFVPDDVSGADVDDAAVCGVRHRRGDQRALPLPHGRGPDGPVDGLNEYRIDEDTSPDLLQVDVATTQRQLDRLEAVKAERDDAAVEETLAALDEAIANGENVMPPIIDAVKAYVTMGEIMAVFEDHYGSYEEIVSLA